MNLIYPTFPFFQISETLQHQMDHLQEKLTKKLKEKNRDDAYKIGHLIVPQISEKISLREINISEIFALCDIRKEMLVKHKVSVKLYYDIKLSQLCRTKFMNKLKRIHELKDQELCDSDEYMKEKL